MRQYRLGALVVATLLLAAVPAFAQGGGASSTGTINGRVADSSGAVLPGATVTITSPALMGSQTDVTNEQGLYRFPAVPPGVYRVAYELAGFNTLVREGIQVTLGFTATVNVELSVATVQETVTVTGESPVVDTTATRVQQNYKLEDLQALPNARDMWSLLAVTPAVVMSRIDVGGNRAGTQTGYQAYGYSGQVRVLVEGINTTEGTGGAGFYFDYGSFEEVFLGTAGQGAEMPHPGVQSQFLGKSGGNNFQGEIYFDYENNDLQGSNIPDDLLARGIRKGSNEIQGYRDFNLNFGGPIKKDKVWWYFSHRDQKNQVAQPNFRFDKTFDTRLWNPSGKVTYLLNQQNKFIGYYQWGQKIQPNRLPFAAYNYDTEEETWRQDSGSWVWKGEWNGTLTDNLYVEARYGDFGYYFPLVANSDSTYYLRNVGPNTLLGGDRKWQTDRDRKQFTTAASWFKDGWGGSHAIKFGGEVLLETQWEGYLQRRAGHIEHILNNGVPSQVVIDFPTATKVDSLSARNGGLLTINKLDQIDLFLSDQWSIGRATLNLGVRFDHYKSWIPDQQQLAFSVAGFSVPARTFPEQTFFTWNSVVPRAGVVYDLTGDGKTVLKANYGLFRHNPGPGIAGSANPNQAAKTLTYTWNDLNGDLRFQQGEQVALQSDLTGPGGIQIDPDIKQPYTHEASIFVEREIVQNMGVRAGYVYKTDDDLWSSYQPFRGIDAYTLPFNFVDRGVDGLLGTPDDATLTFLGIPRANLAAFPATTVIQNVGSFGRYKTFEVSVAKRHSNRWSFNVGGSYTRTTDFPYGFPNNPNTPADLDYSRWDFKATGTYDAPWGIKLSPVLRHQAGPNFARELAVTAAAATGALFSGTVIVEPYDTRRQDNITVFDIRAEKVVTLPRTMRVRLFLDVFNIANSSAAETISRGTGTSFLLPTALLAPRVARVGFRFMW
jgi:hypothetical protein